jgi:hypothetical protein
VCHAVCSCGGVVPFDGQEHALLVIADLPFVFTYEILTEYLALVMQNDVSVSAFLAMKRPRWRAESVPTVSHFYRALRRFTSLVPLEQDARCRCNLCKDEPRVVLCDATAASNKYVAFLPVADVSHCHQNAEHRR